MVGTNGSVKDLGVAWLTGTDIPDYESLTSEEETLFNVGFSQITATTDYLNNTALSDSLRQFKNDYKIFIETAKYSFKQAFGGTLLASGFNMQLIRAATLLTGSGSTATYDWTKSIGNADLGWGSLFGSFTSPINLGTSNSSNALGNTYNQVSMLATHLVDTVPPLYDEIQVKIQGTTYEVYPTRFTEVIERVFITRLPAPMFIKVNGQFAIEANYRRTGQSNPQFLGLQAAPYSYASQQ